MRSKPSYTISIPSEVRFDKRLTLIEKMLFGEIRTLCSKYGYCWASNNYFADIYDIGTRTIINGINKLEEIGLIRREIKNNNKRVLCVLKYSIDSDSVKEHTECQETLQQEDIKIRGVIEYNLNGVKNNKKDVDMGVLNYTHNINNTKDYNNINNKNYILSSKDNNILPKSEISDTTNSNSILKKLQQTVKPNQNLQNISKTYVKDIKNTKETVKDTGVRKQQGIVKNLTNHFLRSYEQLIPQDIKDTFCEWIGSIVELGCSATKTMIDKNADIVVEMLKIEDEDIVNNLIIQCMACGHRTLMYVFSNHEKSMKQKKIKQKDGSLLLVPTKGNATLSNCGPKHITKEQLDAMKQTPKYYEATTTEVKFTGQIV